MPKSHTAKRTLTCDLCGGSLEKGSGDKCRCKRCGKIHFLAELSQDKRAPRTFPVDNLSPRHASVENIAFYCLACQSRLVARCSDVGQKTKCPTCGVGNTVPTRSTSASPRTRSSRHSQNPSEPSPKQTLQNAMANHFQANVPGKKYRHDEGDSIVVWPLPWNETDCGAVCCSVQVFGWGSMWKHACWQEFASGQ